MTDTEEFDLQMVFDLPNAFATLLYQCKSEVRAVEGNDVLIDNTAVLIRATMLTEKSERKWMYGDNRPKWLLSFMDNNHDDIETRIRAEMEKRVTRLAS